MRVWNWNIYWEKWAGTTIVRAQGKCSMFLTIMYSPSFAREKGVKIKQPLKVNLSKNLWGLPHPPTSKEQIIQTSHPFRYSKYTTRVIRRSSQSSLPIDGKLTRHRQFWWVFIKPRHWVPVAIPPREKIKLACLEKPIFPLNSLCG